MELSKITLTSGTAYLVKHDPKDVFEKVSHSDGKPKNHIHRFKLENEHDIYINATYILTIEKVSSHLTHMNQTSDGEEASEKAADDERTKNNLEAAKEFKKDLNGNME